MKKGITLITLIITVIVMLILLTTVSITGFSAYNNSVKISLASEIASLQVATDNYYTKSGEYPTNQNVQLDISNVSENSKEQFMLEDIVDNKIMLEVIDYTLLGFKSLKYGLSENGDNDIYAVSNITGKVYYLKGITLGNYTYYSLNDELTELINFQDIDISNSNADGIIINSSDITWTNEDIDIEIRIPTNIEVTSVLDGTTTVTNNELNNTNTYYIYNITNINSNRDITINYVVNNESKTEVYNVNNIDKVSPILVVSEEQKLMESVNDIYAYTTITVTDELSDIKVVKYENEIIGDSSNDGLKTIEAYFENNGNISYDDMLEIEANVSDITIYVEDSAGNWTVQYVEVQEEIYNALFEE